jgi:hypothetical protein
VNEPLAQSSIAFKDLSGKVAETDRQSVFCQSTRHPHTHEQYQRFPKKESETAETAIIINADTPRKAYEPIRWCRRVFSMLFHDL